MHDGDVAGEQVGELRQEQRRAQIVHQLFIEEAGRQVAFRGRVEDRNIDCDVALAATGGDDHVHPREDFLVTLDAGGVQRKARGISTDALPQLHLPWSPFFGICASKLTGASGCTMYGAKRVSSTLTRLAFSASQCASSPSPSDDTMPMPVIQTSFAWLIA